MVGRSFPPLSPWVHEFSREIFQAIEEHSRTEYGYASVSMLDSLPAHQKDEMPRYVL
jgi:mannosyl-oligosaccharide alpha-1,2-mannosidase